MVGDCTPTTTTTTTTNTTTSYNYNDDDDDFYCRKNKQNSNLIHESMVGDYTSSGHGKGRRRKIKEKDDDDDDKNNNSSSSSSNYNNSNYYYYHYYYKNDINPIQESMVGDYSPPGHGRGRHAGDWIYS